MQGRQIRLNGEELKTQNLFFVAFSLEKLKGFVHCTNKHVCKYNAKNSFCFFATYGTGNTHLHHFQTTKRQLKQRFAYQKVTTVWKKYVTTLSFATAQTHSKHGQNACRFCVLRHCTRKTFFTISSALQFASAYQTTNKTIWFLLSKCVTPQTNKFLCVRTTENAFVLFANLLFKMYKTVNRQYKRNILRFSQRLNKLLFPVYESMKNLQTLQRGLRILCKKSTTFALWRAQNRNCNMTKQKNLTSNEVRFFVFVSIT